MIPYKRDFVTLNKSVINYLPRCSYHLLYFAPGQWFGHPWSIVTASSEEPEYRWLSRKRKKKLLDLGDIREMVWIKSKLQLVHVYVWIKSKLQLVSFLNERSKLVICISNSVQQNKNNLTLCVALSLGYNT